MNEKTAKGLANAVYHWLEYQYLCGHDSLFSESFLRFPVGEFLCAHNPAEKRIRENSIQRRR